MTGEQAQIGQRLGEVDATTDEDIARHMAKDDTPELTNAQLAKAEIMRATISSVA